MTDRIDEEGRASFVQTLPRKVTELRATLGTLVADPKSQRMRDELRRRLHALYTLTRSYQLQTLSDGLREGIAHLDAIRGASVLSQRDLETLADLIATLSALAQRDLPDQPNLFQRARTAAASPSVRPEPPTLGPVIKRASLPPMPLAKSERTTAMGMPAVHPPTRVDVVAPIVAAIPLVNRSTSPSTTPLGVLVVGGEGLTLQARRALPPEAEISSVRTLSDAISAARDTSPDVIVAEVSSPADGLGLLAALRGDPLTDFLPVVLLASITDGIEPERARAQGAAELLTLPVEPERLRSAIERAAQGVTAASVPPPSFGDVTLEELTKALQEEIRRGILGAAGPRAGNARISLGQGSEVLAATWEAIARVRDVVEKRTRGKVRFELPGSPLGFAGAHVLSIGAEEEGAPDDDGALDDPLPGRQALVVDDDPGVVWFFSGLLKEAGMSVMECTEGTQALHEARRLHPDVIISDILMPGMDGFALCRAIRRDVALRNTPVILLSWKEDLLVRMRELGANAQGFLRKESKREAILARVRAVVRPRVRLLRRLEVLAEGAELRGRVERVGVFTLVESTARALVNATLTVTDSFSVTEMEMRDAKLAAVVRTLQDGSLVRGESALLQVLGASNARFAVRRAAHTVRANVHGELAALLEGGAALISAVEDSLSGAALLDVASIDLDSEAAIAYARSLPEAMRGIVERIVLGESPRNLVLRDGLAPQELEPILVELARRGAIRSVRGAEGEDLVAPRFTAAQATGQPTVPKADSGTMPAVLQAPAAPAAEVLPAKPEPIVEAKTEATDAITPSPPEAVVAATPAPVVESSDLLFSSVKSTEQKPAETTASSESAPVERTPSWRPPLSADEAAKPGFGLEGQRDSLENAVLQEISEGSDEPELTAGDDEESEEEDDDTPEFAEEEGEASLSDEELQKAAQRSGRPLGGVTLDARGLPRKRITLDDLPAIEGDAFTPHEPVKRDTAPSDSIIIDVKALGAQVEVRDAPPPSKKKAAAERGKSASGRPSFVPPADNKTSALGWVWILLGMVVLGVGSYLIVRYALVPSGPAVPLENDAAAVMVPAAESDAGASAVVPVVAQASVDAETANTAVDAASATQLAPTVVSNAGADAGLEYEDPAPFLDGGALQSGRGLLVIDGPRDPDGEITVNQHAVGLAPTSLTLPPGVHTIRYRTHAVVVFRFVPVQAGRAVRITLPREP